MTTNDRTFESKRARILDRCIRTRIACECANPRIMVLGVRTGYSSNTAIWVTAAFSELADISKLV